MLLFPLTFHSTKDETNLSDNLLGIPRPTPTYPEATVEIGVITALMAATTKPLQLCCLVGSIPELEVKIVYPGQGVQVLSESLRDIRQRTNRLPNQNKHPSLIG